MLTLDPKKVHVFIVFCSLGTEREDCYAGNQHQRDQTDILSGKSQTEFKHIIWLIIFKTFIL